MNCNIVLHDNCRGWILEKMARRLDEALRGLGVNSAVSNRYAADVDINHFMIFHYVEGSQATRNTMFITHVDDALKLRMIKDSLTTIDVGICMSRMTTKMLVDQGVPRDRLCYIAPAHDGKVMPRRVRIGITSNLVSDGRKREFLLARLAKDVDLTDFHFEVFGGGWSKTAAQLRAGGATVTVNEGTSDLQADYEGMWPRIQEFDFYLYMGLDEGSLGTLDALSAGVPTIITPQGFHLDIDGGMTYPFWEYAELRKIFEDIGLARRRRIASVADLTWAEYARRHVLVWRALLDARRGDLPRLMGQEDLATVCAPRHEGRARLARRVAAYAKLTNGYRWRMVKMYYLPRFRYLVQRASHRLGLS